MLRNILHYLTTSILNPTNFNLLTSKFTSNILIFFFWTRQNEIINQTKGFPHHKTCMTKTQKTTSMLQYHEPKSNTNKLTQIQDMINPEVINMAN